ncbi:MAG: hypothetical protein U9R75_00605 [Candidatus Thermoplasmatota archaeon]|nr:hypothetical protein [Candidatus Thermoplasmatota archaeon]
MPISDSINERSLEELGSIFAWVSKSPKRRRTVLIGGWAVYLYNPYFGSIDLDLVTSSRNRKSLSNFLRRERGFEYRRRVISDDRKLSLRVGNALIDIDFATFGTEDPFEGIERTLPMSILDQRTVTGSIKDISIELADISMMLIFKCKAAWDRARRLENRTSNDPAWDQSKLVKDRSDIIALIDSDEILDLGFLGTFFEENEFLEPVIDELTGYEDAIIKYGKDRDAVIRKIDRLRSNVFR